MLDISAENDESETLQRPTCQVYGNGIDSDGNNHKSVLKIDKQLSSSGKLLKRNGEPGSSKACVSPVENAREPQSEGEQASNPSQFVSPELHAAGKDMCETLSEFQMTDETDMSERYDLEIKDTSDPFDSFSSFGRDYIATREDAMRERVQLLDKYRQRDHELHNKLNAGFEKEVSQLLREKNKFLMDLKLKTMECEKMNQTNKELEREHKNTKRKLQEQENALRESFSDIKKIEEKVLTQQQAIRMKNFELDAQKRKLKEKDEVLREAFQEIQNLKGIISQREDKLEEKKLSINDLQKEIEKLKLESARISSQHIETDKKLMKSNKANEDLQEKLREKNGVIEQLKENNRDLLISVERLETLLNDSKAQNEGLSIEAAKISEELKEKSNKVNDATMTIEEVENDLREELRKTSLLEAKKQDLEFEVERLGNMLKEANEKNALLNDEIAKFSVELREVKDKLNNSKITITQLQTHEKEAKRLKADKEQLQADIAQLQELDNMKNSEFAKFITNINDKLSETINQLAQSQSDNEELQSKLNKSLMRNNKLEKELIKLKNWINRKMELDLQVHYTWFPSSVTQSLSLSDSDEGKPFQRKMIKIDQALLDKVRPAGIRKESEIDIFVRLIESNLVKDGVLLRLNVKWNIMTLLRAGIAGWQYLLCHPSPDQDKEQLAALRANRRINWVMGVNTSNYKQVKSVAMVKIGLGVKFYGNQLSRKIRDYPKLLKHNGKIWIIAKEFLNMKPSSSCEIRYSERFWRQAEKSGIVTPGKSGDADTYRVRVIPGKSTRTKSESILDVRDEERSRSRSFANRESTRRQRSLERKLSQMRVNRKRTLSQGASRSDTNLLASGLNVIGNLSVSPYRIRTTHIPDLGFHLEEYQSNNLDNDEQDFV